ncbi:MAG: hypothetical protein AB7F86_17425 [Bdellovibrionales bacterium]
MRVLIVFVWALWAGADQLVPFKFNSPSKVAIPIQTECKFKNLNLPKDLEVFATGGHNVGRPLDYQIDASGSMARQLDVAVNSKKKPVALILGSGGPTIWNIGWTNGTNIIAVVVSGYQRQAIAGLPEKTPVLYSTQQGPCDLPVLSQNNMSKINATSILLFNKEVTAAFNPDNGAVLVGQDLASTDRLVNSNWRTVESFIDKDAPLAGRAGLQDAETKGIIRRPNELDMVNLQKFFAQIERTTSAGPGTKMVGFGSREVSFSQLVNSQNSFLILKKFTFPPGMNAAGGAIFFIPENVSKPEGDAGHSTVIDMARKTCRGYSCPKGLTRVGQ